MYRVFFVAKKLVLIGFPGLSTVKGTYVRADAGSSLSLWTQIPGLRNSKIWEIR